METPSIRCNYYNEAAIWTRISIIIKRRQKRLDAFQNKGFRKYWDQTCNMLTSPESETNKV